MAKHKHDARETTILDHTYTAAHAGVSVVPYVGGPAVELFNVIITSPIEKRKHESMEVVGEGVCGLAAR
jgi:hypothetical protein